MNYIKNAVFPVVTKERELFVFQGHGTTFFIDENGLFITASHTFKDPFRENYALIDGKRFEIEKIWSEYVDYDCQKPDIYKDLFIGRVLEFDSSEFYEFHECTQDIPDGAMLLLEGYKMGEKSPIEVTKVGDLNMDDLFTEVMDDDYQGLPTQEEEKAELLEFVPINAYYVQQNFKHIDLHSEINEEFTNGISIKMDVKNPHGRSGGPLLYERKVVGMLIGQTGIISADYIQSKLAIHVDNLQITETYMPEMIVKETGNNTWLISLIKSVHEILDRPDSRYRSEYKTLSFLSSDDIGSLQIVPRVIGHSALAVTESNYQLNNRPTHLIIVNPHLCKEARLTVPELQAVIIHEIGHVLNMYEQKLSVKMKSTSDEDLMIFLSENKRIKEENLLNNELYADDYVRQQGYICPLISSMQKYLNINNTENTELMNRRLQYFRNNPKEDLKGEIKVLR